MSEQRRQILQMLADGKINADEAERLLTALENGAKPEEEAKTESSCCNPKAKYLYVNVKAEPGSHHRHENVDIKIPIMLLKAGMKLGSLMPEGARGKISEHLSSHGIDMDLGKLDSEKIDILVAALCENSIDISSENEKVRIYCC